MHRVFIDGQVGTTGLQIHERLNARTDIELLKIDPAERKDPHAKKAIIDAADVVLLCLPDDAAVETVAMDTSEKVRFIDASTAHRTNTNWVYGFPEMATDQRAKIASARLVSNPGCYPTGFLAAIKPLIDVGLLRSDALITISAISGYSGGGRQLIERYEAHTAMNPDSNWHARPYALKLKHKHIPEMRHFAALEQAPIFLPIVGNFHQGMLVSVPVFQAQMTQNQSPQDIHALLTRHYESEPCINVLPLNTEAELDDGFLDPQLANGTNRIDLFVYGHEEQIVLIARLDNLGKGAAGAAIQNLNLMLQVPELEGLAL
ncbi:MAG: N-acetyl-gamma-glutamyl-phosphate reductase [Gammaproteobacteria bacterium]|jgi:N-acetyl-gamma-glutamyl-phosphate reductase|nr:N-acetyl-gamma-glutamyl-phosphate reductase [Gammaproteobacteria bacterium]MBT4492818.1 N-acetyl-gamma-glutamyl-phosphate reductase [Gammaproteobacteria bacterium]MBT7369018.1 N-acetyl-gamma-glutamyl-phosphate reductase [Gammaproteobacteria bacterium]